MTHPRHWPGQPLEDHQREMAAWMGYDTPEAMNAAHDGLHEALCQWLGVPSHSLAASRGETHDARLAELEENAVLNVQRFMVHAMVGVPA